MFAIVAAFALASNYNIIQRGNDINGNKTDDKSGHSVALAAGGTVLAIGEPHINQVRVLNFENNSWGTPQIISGQGKFGDSISLSEDGTVLASVAPDENALKVFTKSTSSWTFDVEFDFYFTDSGTTPYFSVSVSADGSTVAIGLPKTSTFSGKVYVYSKRSSSWAQLGNEIEGQNGEELGHDVALSGNGARLVVSSHYHDSFKGKIQLYQFSGGSWSSLGPPILGNDNEAFADSLAISHDGTIIAASSDSAAESRGHVKVFRFNGATFDQKGSTISGSENERLGKTLSMSPDGTLLIVEARQFSAIAGNVKVFSFDANGWREINTSSSGVANGDFFGGSLSLSTNTLPNCPYSVAIGDPSNNEVAANAGQTRVYDVCVSSTDDDNDDDDDDDDDDNDDDNDDDDDDDITLVLAITIPVVLLAIVLIVRQCFPEYWPQSLRANFVGL